MSNEPPLKNGFFDQHAYEIVHDQQEETPRQCVLRLTGRDVSFLTTNGRDSSWQEVREAGMLPFVLRLLMTSTHVPAITLRKREKQDHDEPERSP